MAVQSRPATAHSMGPPSRYIILKLPPGIVFSQVPLLFLQNDTPRLTNHSYALPLPLQCLMTTPETIREKRHPLESDQGWAHKCHMAYDVRGFQRGGNLPSICACTSSPVLKGRQYYLPRSLAVP